MVYSLEPGFIEADVVRGFIRSGHVKAKKKASVRVILPVGHPRPTLPAEYADQESAFDIKIDSNPAWEISYYRSLASIDGVVLIGGGRSTLITGVLALTYRIPLVALAAYGGNAGACWRSLVAGRDLPSESEIQSMVKPVKPATSAVVEAWSASLAAQAERRERERRVHRRIPWATLVALLLLVAWVAALPLGFGLSEVMLKVDTSVGALAATAAVQEASLARTRFLFLLFLAPLLSGASGATIRALLPSSGSPSMKNTVLGVAAGAITSILYVLAQLMGNPSLPNSFVILGFSVAFGFVAGFTFDVVFERLRSSQVLDTSALGRPSR